MFSIEGGDFMKNKIFHQLNIESFVCANSNVVNNAANNGANEVNIANIT